MKDNTGTEKNPNEPHQNYQYQIVKLNKTTSHNEIRKASSNDCKQNCHTMKLNKAQLRNEIKNFHQIELNK